MIDVNVDFLLPGYMDTTGSSGFYIGCGQDI
jgi:hypothetical protein